MQWVGEYIGLPYRAYGRDRQGVDCWGLVRLVLAEHFSIELPDLVGDYDAADDDAIARLIDDTRTLVDAEPIDEPRDGDIAVLRYMGHTTHVGVVVGDSVLHASGTRWSILQRRDSVHIAPRIRGYYRVS
ncbi:MAG: NlpC/P60 family protein [Alkalispirochaeta sp.]